MVQDRLVALVRDERDVPATCGIAGRDRRKGSERRSGEGHRRDGATRGRLNAEVVLVTDRAFDPIALPRAEELGLKVIDVGESAPLVTTGESGG
jgi:hypothetical protein